LFYFLLQLNYYKNSKIYLLFKKLKNWICFHYCMHFSSAKKLNEAITVHNCLKNTVYLHTIFRNASIVMFLSQNIHAAQPETKQKRNRIIFVAGGKCAVLAPAA
jgi:hypothetical protein